MDAEVIEAQRGLRSHRCPACGLVSLLPDPRPLVHLFLTGSAAAALAPGYQWNMMPETTIYCAVAQLAALRAHLHNVIRLLRGLKA